MSTPEQALEVVDRTTPIADDHSMQMGELMGAARLADEMVKRFSAQTMRMLQVFRDEKGYLAYGFKTFDQFLDNHPRSPMSKHQFYEREKPLGLEGADAFNALNALRFPISKRKLLKEGDVSIEGDNVKIGEQEFSIKNEVAVWDALSNLYLERKQLLKKIDVGEKDVDKYKRRAGELEAQLSHGGISVDGTAHGRALVNALGDLSLLKEEISKIEDDAERKRFGDQALELIAKQKLELEQSLGYVEPEES